MENNALGTTKIISVNKLSTNPSAVVTKIFHVVDDALPTLRHLNGQVPANSSTMQRVDCLLPHSQPAAAQSRQVASYDTCPLQDQWHEKYLKCSFSIVAVDVCFIRTSWQYSLIRQHQSAKVFITNSYVLRLQIAQCPRSRKPDLQEKYLYIL